jgi:predicted nucleic acid-binding Zn ribbon protein|tara:strand:- start:274 stop:537 length:264 start_codon:yes stop_codon:yes gene_type:complete
MPTYIFKNTKTEEVFEQQMRISELDDFKKSNPDLIQMPTAPSFRLKGTGWYETDFKTGKKKNIAKSDNETQTTNKTKDKNDASKASS